MLGFAAVGSVLSSSQMFQQSDEETEAIKGRISNVK